MAAIWPELYRDRWSWSERSLSLLRREVFGLDDDLEQSRLANVMVVGDTQVGKTTLLIRLLGVTDPACLEETEKVLRAGRDKGNSATSVPIRYRWSTDRDRWLLVRGMSRRSELLTSEELRDLLAEFRSFDGSRLQWRASDRPLEIGLPTRLAGEAARAELRVLDLPGLYAASEPEREAAQAMVSRFAPVMNLVVFVQCADGMANGFNDKAIRTNLHLSAWIQRRDGYRVVLTRAFSPGSLWKDYRRRLESPDPAWRMPEVIANDVRRFMAAELMVSLSGGIDADQLAEIVYPVDLGDSWREFRESKPPLAELVRPANELMIEALRLSIEVKASEDDYHLAAPEIAQRIADRIRQRAAGRARHVKTLRAELREQQELANDAGKVLAAQEQQRDQATASLAGLGRAIDDLRTRTPPYARPARPPMEGLAVRASQEDERQAWYAAVWRMWSDWWSDWRATTAEQPAQCPLPKAVPLSEASVRKRYDQEVSCCEQCTENTMSRWWHGRNDPEHCYRRMGNATDAINQWIRGELTTAAQAASKQAELALDNAEERCAAAVRERDRCRTALDDAHQRLAAAEQADAMAGKRDQRDLASAAAVTTILDRENKAYVEALLSRMRSAGAHEQGWYAVAALRALYDLERMIRD